MMLRRTINVVLIITAVIGAAVVYRVKYDAQSAHKRIAALEAQITAERDAISILKAEWSLLNQPDRLQNLTEQYAEALQLAPLEIDQIATIEELPARPLELMPKGTGNRALGGYAGSTSSVVR